jgi:hypothetical protein
MMKRFCSTSYFTPNIIDNGLEHMAEKEKCDAFLMRSRFLDLYIN